MIFIDFHGFPLIFIDFRRFFRRSASSEAAEQACRYQYKIQRQQYQYSEGGGGLRAQAGTFAP